MIDTEKCYYCGDTFADANASFQCPMFKDVRGKIFQKTERTTISIPRCRNCKSIHHKYRNLALLLGFTISSIVFSYPVIYQFNRSLWLSVGLGFMWLVLGNVLGNILNEGYFSRRIIPRKYGIKHEENVHMASAVCEMQHKSWSLHDPDPG